MPDRDWCQIWTCKNDVVVTKQTPRLGVSRYLGVLKSGTGNNCAIILTLHWDTPSDPCLGPHRFVLQRIASQMKYYASRNFLEWGLRHRWYFLGGFPSRETRNEQRGECKVVRGFRCGRMGADGNIWTSGDHGVIMSRAYRSFSDQTITSMRCSHDCIRNLDKNTNFSKKCFCHILKEYCLWFMSWKFGHKGNLYLSIWIFWTTLLVLMM